MIFEMHSSSCLQIVQRLAVYKIKQDLNKDLLVKLLEFYATQCADGFLYERNFKHEGGTRTHYLRKVV